MMPKSVFALVDGFNPLLVWRQTFGDLSSEYLKFELKFKMLNLTPDLSSFQKVGLELEL